MAHIEHHPENGCSPYIVVAPAAHGARLWFAYRSREEAECKLPMIEREMLRTDGVIEIEHPSNVTMQLPSA